MTRKKKTRSLKRIHNTKTGSISKLKREAGNDRQSKKRIKGKRTPSVFEKYLNENPDVKAQLNAEQVQSSAPAPKESKAAETKEDTKKPTLLQQLDDKSFDDLY